MSDRRRAFTKRDADEARRQAGGQHLRREYHQWKATERKRLYLEHPELMEQLDGEFRRCSLVNLNGIMGAIVGNVAVRRLDDDSKHRLLGYVSERLVALREAAAIEPFHDALDDRTDPSAPIRDIYLIIRSFIRN